MHLTETRISSAKEFESLYQAAKVLFWRPDTTYIPIHQTDYVGIAAANIYLSAFHISVKVF